MASSVPAEDEFVEIALDKGLSQSVKDALGPSLEVREDPVDPFQDFMGVLPLDDAHLVWVGRRVLIAQSTVGEHPGPDGIITVVETIFLTTDLFRFTCLALLCHSDDFVG